MQIPANNPCTIAPLSDRAGQLLFLFQSQRILDSSSDCRILALSAAIVWLAFQILSKFVVGRRVWAGATFYERARDAATQIWPGKRLLRAARATKSDSQTAPVSRGTISMFSLLALGKIF